MAQLEDGTGTGNRAKIQDNRVYVNALTLGNFENAVLNGNAYNVNTELLTITSNTEHALLYIKNNENTDIVLESWFIGTDLGTNGVNLGIVRAYFEPTGGTIISGGSSVDVINRKGGDSKLAKVTALSGGQGFTATGVGSPVLYQTQSVSSRVFGNIKLSLEAGKSIVITYVPNGAETIGIYAGFQFYVNK